MYTHIKTQYKDQIGRHLKQGTRLVTAEFLDQVLAGLELGGITEADLAAALANAASASASAAAAAAVNNAPWNVKDETEFWNNPALVQGARYRSPNSAWDIVAKGAGHRNHPIADVGVKFVPVAGGVNTKQVGALANDTANDAFFVALTISVAISLKCDAIISEGGIHRCSTRIGDFDGFDGLTIRGGVIRHAAGGQTKGLIGFGDQTLDAYGMFTNSNITVRNLKIEGVKFLTSGGVNSATSRWVDHTPISVNNAQFVRVTGCSFKDYDFAALSFGSRCLDVDVDNNKFFSSRKWAGGVNYAVRVFCYANYTNFANGNGDLEPTNPVTGELKSGYTMLPDTAEVFGHERFRIFKNTFINCNRPVMTAAARYIDVFENSFVNSSTRSVSFTTYTQNSRSHDNTYLLNTAEQDSEVTVFVAIGQETFDIEVEDETFIVCGNINGANDELVPVRAYFNSHRWRVKGCKFDLPDYNKSVLACMYIYANSDGTFEDNEIRAPYFSAHVVYFPGNGATDPAYTQKAIHVRRNKVMSGGALVHSWGAVANNEPIYVHNNEFYPTTTRFITHATPGPNVSKFHLQGNKLLGSPVRYVDNVAAGKAILLAIDVLDFDLHFATTSALGAGRSVPVTFNWSARHIPACFASGQKSLAYSAYGHNPGNGQMAGDLSFTPSEFTATTLTGALALAAGGVGNFIGNASLKVKYLPLIT